MAIDNTSKIKFLYGPAENLDKLTTSENGTFYLTDEHRLYIGEGGKPILLNQEITFVDTGADLPTTGKPEQLCYIRKTHILAAWDAETVNTKTNTKGVWVQINPNTQLAANSNAVSVTESTETETDSNDSNKQVTRKVATVKTTISDTDSNNATGSFALIEGDGIGISQNGNKIKISSTTVGGTSMDLKAENVTGMEANKQAKIVQSTTPLDASGKAGTTINDSITLKSGNFIEKVYVSDTTEKAEVITIDAEGQGVKNASFSTAESKDGFTLTIEQSADETTEKAADLGTKTATLDPIISIDGNTAVHFKNGTADLTSLATQTYVNDKILQNNKDIDALRFISVLTGDMPDLTNGTVKAGYTYKIGEITASSELFTWAQKNDAKTGDLIIVTSSGSTGENADGTIKSGGDFMLVPSGDEYSYKGVAITNGFKIQDSGDNDVGTLNFTAGTDMTVAGSATSGNTQTITFSHAAKTVSKPATETAKYDNNTNKMSVTVVKNITEDSTGHISKVETVTLPIVDRKNSEITQSISTTNNVATIKTEIKDSEADVINDNFTITSDNLTVTSTTEALNISMLWGSF